LSLSTVGMKIQESVSFFPFLNLKINVTPIPCFGS
jgi:hypothetical protein